MYELFSADAYGNFSANSLIVSKQKERNDKMKEMKSIRGSRFAHVLKRLLGDQCGAVAMEYIVIALLIGAAVVALVMVLSGSLRNAGSSINKTINAKTVDEVQTISTDHNTARDGLNQQNTTANGAGDKLGGDFGTK